MCVNDEFWADEESSECREVKENSVSVETSRVSEKREESELKVASLSSLAVKKTVTL